MSRNTLLALWGAATLLGYLITFFFNVSGAGADASSAVPDPPPAAEQAGAVTDEASGARVEAGEAVARSETLSVDTGFPTGEDDTLAVDTSAVGTVPAGPAYNDSVLVSTVSGGTGGPDTTLASAAAPADTPADAAAGDVVDPDPGAPVPPDVLRSILLMWVVLMAFPVVMGVVLSAIRRSEHLVLSAVWALLIGGALVQNFWAVGAAPAVKAFSFYPLWFFVAAVGFAITAVKLDLGAQTRLYAAAAGANLVFGLALVFVPALSAFAFLVAAGLQGVPIILDPIVTARAQRQAG